MPLLSVIILTRDEEVNLPHCLDSLRRLDCAVFVVDSGSRDRTVEIARDFGATVVDHTFENYARQFNWALDHLPIATPWIMRLDADERLIPELATELGAILPVAPAGVGGFLVKRRVYFWGRWIRHGGYYPTWLLRVWRAGEGRCEDVWMDEHIILSAGETRRLTADIIDDNHKGLAFWIDKHNNYSDREVKNLVGGGAAINAGQAGAQAARRRLLKRAVYGRAPLFLRAFLYWVFRYFVLLGFLDGKAGFVFHFLQGFWYRLLVDAKLYEHDQQRAMERRDPGEP